MKKKTKIILLSIALIITLILGRLIFVYFQQNAEFAYHENIPKTISLWSNDFSQNSSIPKEFTGKGGNISPSLFWDNIPKDAQSLVILVTDYDAPAQFFRLFTVDHWVLYNINPNTKSLSKSVISSNLLSNGISLGKNITGGVEYVGPNPPIGTHKYYFRIYALSIPKINLTTPTKKEIMDNMKNHIISYGELVGLCAS